MTQGSPLATTVAFHVGPLLVTRPVVTTWGIMTVLAVGSWLLTRRLRPEPSRRQAILELVVSGIESQIGDVVRRGFARW